MKRYLIVFNIFILILLGFIKCNPSEDRGEKILTDILAEYSKDEIIFDISIKRENMQNRLLGIITFKDGSLTKFGEKGSYIENYKITKDYILIKMADGKAPNMINYTAKIPMKDVIDYIRFSKKEFFYFYDTEIIYTKEYDKIFNGYFFKAITEILMGIPKYDITLRTNNIETGIYLGSVYFNYGKVDKVEHVGHGSFTIELENMVIKDDFIKFNVILNDLNKKDSARYSATYTKDEIIRSLEELGGNNSLDLYRAEKVD